jgi:precorrin-2 dehydrogenase/sirohydrochlorin ferrochelatase
MSRPALPLFLRLDGRPCLVVGGGTIAAEKSRRLLESGARVTAVATRFDGGMESLAREGGLRLVRRPFESGDVQGHTLVVAATDNLKVQLEVSEAARASGVLCNVVDVPELCDVTFGAILRRGDLQVAVSTGGRFPLLASRLRDRIGTRLHPAAGEGLEALAGVRDEVRRTAAGDIPLLRRVLGGLVTQELIDLIERGDLEGLRGKIEAWNSSPTR